LDGELHRSTPVEITLEPGFLHVLAPQDAPKDLFVRSGAPLQRAIEDKCVGRGF
jgi:hypothetical protein